MRINVTDSDNNGMTETLYDINPGTTVGEYFTSRKPGCNMAKYKVYVNGQQASASTSLTVNCTMSIQPAKLAGAAGLAVSLRFAA